MFTTISCSANFQFDSGFLTTRKYKFWHGFMYGRNFCSIKKGKQLDGLLDPESEQSVSLLCICHFPMKKY